MSKQTGDKGEVIAANYLRKNGYEVLHTNWRHSHLELDIIAQKDEMLVVVEVKTGNSSNFGEPQEWVTRTKQKRVIKAADAFLLENNITFETQFDIIAVLFTPNGPQVTHIKDAFSAIC